MRLTALHPKISTKLIEALENSEIFTVEEIFLTDADELCRRLSINTISIQEIKQLKLQTRYKLSALGTRANNLFIDQQKSESQREKCYSGIESVDDLFGGFGKYGITEIAGGKGSGRSGLVLNITLRHMSSYPRHKTVWFDVGGEFDIERTYMIASLHAGATAPEAILDNFNVIPCFEVAPVYEHLQDLEKSLGKGSHDSRTRFIVIDSLTPLLAPLLSAASSQGQAVMSTLMRRLASLARTHSLTVIVITDAAQFHTEKKTAATLIPSLGPSFTFLTNETLWLSVADDRLLQDKVEEPLDRRKVFVAEVLRTHDSSSPGDWCYFTMQNGISLDNINPS